MGGYYVPSSFSSNYVKNKKNEDGTYVYDDAANKLGMDTQRNLQQLNKQYNVTINQAYANNLLSNRGLRASTLGTGYKQAYAERLQASVNDEINQVSYSVADTKQSIFESLGKNLGILDSIQQQEIGNMGRMAGNLEQYHEYVKGLTDEGMNKYTDMNEFNMGDTDTFEDNYNNLFGMNKGTVAGYSDENNNPALAYEDWLRQNEKDTGWLDWAYGGGMTQYQDFINYIDPNNKGSNASKVSANPAAPAAPAKKFLGLDLSGPTKKWWQIDWNSQQTQDLLANMLQNK